jgi:hypothetical protein
MLTVAELLEQAFAQSQQARGKILDLMEQTIAGPRPDLARTRRWPGNPDDRCSVLGVVLALGQDQHVWPWLFGQPQTVHEVALRVRGIPRPHLWPFSYQRNAAV